MASNGNSENFSTVVAEEDDVKYGFKRSEMYKANLAGTVDPYDRHVFLCYKSHDTWPAKVEDSESDLLPMLFSVVLKNRKNDFKAKTRLTIIESREDMGLSDGDVLIFPEMIKYSELNESNVDGFVEDVLVNGNPWANGNAEVLAGSYVFVCAHNKRDRRCGVCGPILMDTFKEEIGAKGLQNQVFVTACSHIGGHKYAGNVIIFSADTEGKTAGHWYGYVTPNDVPDLIDQHIGKSQIISHLWRGQMGSEPVIEAVNQENPSETKLTNGEVKHEAKESAFSLNTSMAENLVHHDKSKHAKIDIHFISEKIEAEVTGLEHVSAENQLAGSVSHTTSSVSHTTLVACCYADGIFVAADSWITRSLCWGQRIISEYVEEAEYIKHCELFPGVTATFSGDVSQVQRVLNPVRREMQQQDGVRRELQQQGIWVTKSAVAFATDRVVQHLARYEGEGPDFFISGWSEEFGCELYEISSGVSSIVDNVSALGSGGDILIEYNGNSYLDQWVEDMDEKQALSYISNAMGYAIRRDPFSGGTMRIIGTDAHGHVSKWRKEPTLRNGIFCYQFVTNVDF